MADYVYMGVIGQGVAWATTIGMTTRTIFAIMIIQTQILVEFARIDPEAILILISIIYSKPQYQKTILHDDRTSSRKYIKISEFGVRPPELNFVFETLASFFRMCYIDNQDFSSEEAMKLGLDQNLDICRWYDGFGRNIYTRKNAMDEILDLVNRKVDDEAYLESVGSSHQEFVRRSNIVVKQKNLLYKANEAGLCEGQIR